MGGKVTEFQRQLLTDKATREAFAANPAKFLNELGVELPANVKVPEHKVDPSVKTDFIRVYAAPIVSIAAEQRCPVVAPT